MSSERTQGAGQCEEEARGRTRRAVRWCQKWKIRLFHTFERFIWGPKEVPEGKMVFSGGSRSGKYDSFTLLKGPVGVRRRSWKAKWCSREVAEVENTTVSHFCKVQCGSEGGPGGENGVLGKCRMENTNVSHFCKVKCGSEGGPGGQNGVLASTRCA